MSSVIIDLRLELMAPQLEARHDALRRDFHRRNASGRASSTSSSSSSSSSSSAAADGSDPDSSESSDWNCAGPTLATGTAEREEAQLQLERSFREYRRAAREARWLRRRRRELEG